MREDAQETGKAIKAIKAIEDRSRGRRVKLARCDKLDIKIKNEEVETHAIQVGRYIKECWRRRQCNNLLKVLC